MSFATAFQIGTSALGLLGSHSQARREAEMENYYAQIAQREAAASRRQEGVDRQFGELMLGYNREQDQYYRDIYEDQNALEAELQAYLRQGDTENARRLEEQIARTRSRQATADRAAREQRMWELERIAYDDNLSEQERNFALNQLREEELIARRERDDEITRIGRADNTRVTEYAEREARLNADRAQRAAERAREVGIQDQILTGASQFRDDMRHLVDSLGSLTPPDLYGPDEIDRLTDRNMEALEGRMDRYVTKLMSEKEADLIRSGVDASSSAVGQRGDLMARVTPEVQAMISQAVRDATGEVEGKNKTLMDRFNALKAGQQDQFEKAAARGTAGLDIMARLNPATSAVYDRDIGTAENITRVGSSERGNDGRGLPSQVRGVRAPSLDIAQFLQDPAFAVNRTASPGYSSGAPRQNSYDFSGFFSGARSGQQNRSRDAAVTADRWYDRASRSAGNFGSALNEFGENLFGDNGWLKDFDLFGTETDIGGGTINFNDDDPIAGWFSSQRR